MTSEGISSRLTLSHPFRFDWSIQGEYGPFRAQNEAVVPFWLAALLKKRNLCRVKPPEWMKAESLLSVLAEEKKNPNQWQELPHHYIEIAKLLFTTAEDDFSEFEMDVHEVSPLVRSPPSFSHTPSALKSLCAPNAPPTTKHRFAG